MEKIDNIINSGDPKTVEIGETILLKATVDKTGEGMFMEFGSIVIRNNHLRARFNKHRKSEYVPGLRRAWEPCTMEDIKDEFDVDLLDLEPEIDEKGREFYTLNILNPTAYNDQTGKIERLCVQINETTKGTPNQVDNWRKKAKKVNDEYFKHNDKLIFANTSIVYGKPNHIFLEHDLPEHFVVIPEEELQEDTKIEGSFLD
tara:strand:+ start:1344 stop:1949 length:606 start_codon:yes stop_codon:yes gene_type:complete